MAVPWSVTPSNHPNGAAYMAVPNRSCLGMVVVVWLGLDGHMAVLSTPTPHSKER